MSLITTHMSLVSSESHITCCIYLDLSYGIYLDLSYCMSHLLYFIFHVASFVFHIASTLIFHIASCILHLSYCILHITYCILHITYYILHITYCIYMFDITYCVYIFSSSDSMLHILLILHSAGCLALYDAGVPLKKAVAGVAMGLLLPENLKRGC